MRPPAMRGTVATTVFPGAPRWMEVSSASTWPVEDGEDGQYAVLASAESKINLLLLSMA